MVGRTIRPALSISKGVGLLRDGPFTGYLDTVDGTAVFYQITMTNVGNVPLTGVTLTDDLTDLHAAHCPTIPTTLAVGQSYTCIYAGVAAQGQKTNTATASSTQTGSVKTSAVVVGRTITRILLITKGVSLDPAGPFIGLVYQTGGKLAYYQITVSNAGNVPLTGITLADSLTDLVARGCVIKTTLAVGASFTCTYSAIVAKGPSLTINTATATSVGTPAVQASATVIGLGGGVEGDTTVGRLRITKVIATATGWRGGTFAFDARLRRAHRLRDGPGRCELGQRPAAGRDPVRHGLHGHRAWLAPERGAGLPLGRRSDVPAGRAGRRELDRPIPVNKRPGPVTVAKTRQRNGVI